MVAAAIAVAISARIVILMGSFVREIVFMSDPSPDRVRGLASAVGAGHAKTAADAFRFLT